MLMSQGQNDKVAPTLPQRWIVSELTISYDSYTNNSFATSKSRRQIYNVFGTLML